MPDNTNPSTQPEGHFEQVLAEILQAEEAGEAVDLSRIARKYPELATPLREYFRNRDGFDRLAPRLAPPASDATGGKPVPQAPDLARGDQFAGYEILRELGRGGMGVVYLALQRSAKRTVALKLIRMDRLGHLSPRQRQAWLSRFRTEGQAMARIADDRVVTVYEVGAHDGRPFYSMRYVAGRSLAKVLESGPLKNRPAAILMEQVARAVQTVHDQGVLHRDLKPHNILVDGQGRPFVSDFGLAKWLGSAESPTHTGEMLGSPEYVSPEQAQDAGQVTRATDVYGLGATLYALLTGRPPFQGKSPVEILYQVKYREPVPPRRLNPVVDRDLNTITLKCLEKEPGRRFGSAADVADELRLYVEGRPIRTRPLGLPGRLGRWGRRNPAVASLSAAAMVLISLAGALYWAYSSLSHSASETGQQLGEVKAEAGEVKAARAEEQERKRADDYLESMGTAQKHVDAGDLAKARDELAKWRPQEGKTDLRSWEWYFVDARCREVGFSVPRGHPGPVQAVAWSPDGTQVASADSQGIVKVWSVAGSKDQPLLEMRANGGVVALAWSPDGKHLAAASPGRVQVWEAASGKETLSLPAVADLNAPIRNAALPGEMPSLDIFLATWSLIWSPTSQKLALAGRDGNVQVWDLTKSKLVSVLGTHAKAVHSAAWAPDGNRLASVGGDGLLKVWDTTTHKEVLTVPLRKTDNSNVPLMMPLPIFAVSWAEDGKHLNLVSDWLPPPPPWLEPSVPSAGDIRIFDASSGTEGQSRRLVQKDRMMTRRQRLFIWGPGGKLLASVDLSGFEVKVWDATTGKEVFSLPPPGTVVANPMPLPGITRRCLAWDPSGRRLVLGEDDGMIQTRYVASSRRALRVQDALAWSTDGQHFFCIEDTFADEMTAIRERASAAMKELQKGGPLSDPDMIKRMQEQMEAVRKASQPGSPPDPNMIKRLLEQPKQEPPKFPKFRPADPNMLKGPGGTGIRKPQSPRIQVCDSVTGEVVRTVSTVKADGPADGKRLPWATARTMAIAALAESPDGKWLAWTTFAGSLQLCPAAGSGEVITLQEPPKDANRSGGGKPGGVSQTRSSSVVPCWSSDSKLLAWSSPHETAIRLWDPNTAKPVPPLEGHGKLLRWLAWSPDGQRLASADEDGAVKVWDVKNRKATFSFTYFLKHELSSNLEKAPAYSMLSWCRDSRQLAVAGEDETIAIWDVDAREKIRTLRVGGSTEPFHHVVGAVAWSPNGKRLAAAGQDGTLLLWDTATWKEILSLSLAPRGPFQGPANSPQVATGGTFTWSPDGWQLRRGNIIWDATPEKEIGGQKSEVRNQKQENEQKATDQHK
jgi:WD40 repeat protein/serine/threonine protein kinase